MAWIVSWLAACAAVLTKSNGLLLIAVLGICLLLRPQLSWKKKIAGGALSVAVFVLLTGWLPIYRFAIEKDMLHAVEVTGTVGTILVTNLTNLHGGLLVDNTPLDYVTFNPRAMLEIPYNHAWLDQARRMYFPEYFYRSIFFGEHDFGMSLALLAAGMLLVGMMLFPFALLGFAHCARNLRSPRFPFVIIFLVMIAGHVAFRITSPYGPSQDFRYSPLIVIAAFAFIADATTFLPAPLRRLSIAVSVGSMILSAAFIISLPFFGPGTEGFVPFFK
jgi:4-amino-4-deoxy-L-arabinose transferase-like glycosyltransferase